MYEPHFGLVSAPFENTPDPRFYYPSADHEEAISRAIYAIRRRLGAAMVTGEVGAGKTLLTRLLLERLAPEGFDVALVVNPALSPPQFLSEVLYQFGNEKPPVGKAALLRLLHRRILDNDAAGRQTILVVDEAQSIRRTEVFEEIRLLLNFQKNDRFLLSILFLGQPELRDRIKAIPQLSQRIALRHHLNPLPAAEVAAYIEHRIQAAGGPAGLFDLAASDAVARASLGIPRLVNGIADRCLLAASLERRTRVDAATADRVVREEFPPAG